MKISKDKIIGCIYIAGIVMLIILMVVCAVIKVWATVKYGDLPITEVPSWVIPWLN